MKRTTASKSQTLRGTARVVVHIPRKLNSAQRSLAPRLVRLMRSMVKCIQEAQGRDTLAMQLVRD